MKLNIISAIDVGLSAIAVSRNRGLKFHDEHLTALVLAIGVESGEDRGCVPPCSTISGDVS